MNIQGTGFGSKAQPTPRQWDDFNDGSNGQGVAGSAPVYGVPWRTWNNQDGTPPKYTTTRTHSGTMAVRSSYHSPEDACHCTYNSSLEVDNNYGNVYATWWSYYDLLTPGIYSRNVKPWGQFATDQYGDDPGTYAGWGDGVTDPSLRSSFWYPNDGDTSNDCNGTLYAGSCGNNRGNISYILGKWVRHEILLKMNTPGAYDGSWTMSIYDGNQGLPTIQDPTFRYRMSSQSHWTYLQVPEYNDSHSGSSGDQSHQANIYTDDFYLDDTPQRVEVCDASTWSQRRHCEIQIPTAWSGTAITVKVNTGTFASGTTAYVYVLDSSNRPSTGTAIQFGPGGSNPSPGTPANLEIQPKK